MNKKVITGVLHLEPFPDSHDKEELGNLIEKALRDLSALQVGGVHQLLIENDFHEPPSPYGEFLTEDQYKVFVSIMKKLKPYIKVPFGFCCLLNDYKSSFKLAKNFGGSFVRLDTFVDPVERISDGIQIIPSPSDILSFQKDIEAEDIELWADVHVKHTKLLVDKTINASILEANKFKADKIIITGGWTGQAPNVGYIRNLVTHFPDINFIIGSGVNKENINEFGLYIDNFIIGSAFKNSKGVSIDKVKEIIHSL